MKVVHKKDYIKQAPEHISPVDIIDRSGYIPLDLKYWQMMYAGAKLESIRSLNYGYDRKAIMDTIDEVGFDEAIKATTLRTPHIDKQTADQLLKDKITKYKNVKSKYDEIERLKDEYNKIQAQEEYDNEVINRYKLEQEKLKNT